MFIIPRTKLEFNKKNHKKLAFWAADSAEKFLFYFEEKYSRDKRPRRAVESARKWAEGKIKCGDARKAAWASHAAARRALNRKNFAACFAARIAGHAAATAHVPRHAYGVTYYAEKIEKILTNANN